MLDSHLVSANVRGLVESFDVEQILPQSYAAYRPLLVDGLCFFLARIPRAHLTRIVSEQLELASDSNFADRVLNLLRNCPTLHKLGQVVSREPRLSRELRQRLQRLESLKPATRTRDIPGDVLDELRNIANIEIADHPLAEASVALVLPFTWHVGGAEQTREGVFKVLKPGVHERLFEELDIWAELGSYLEERCEHHGLPVLDYRETLDIVRRLLQQEVHFELEQKHLGEAADFYRDNPAVVIPRLFPFCSKQVTAMQRVDGVKVTDAEIDDSARRKLADTLVGALIASPFWDPADVARFHADPHAGNLFHTSDGRLAIFDWTLVGYLDKAQRTDFVQIILGAFTLNETRICRAVSNLGRNQPEESQLRVCVADALREVRQGSFPGFGWTQRLLDRVATSTGMGFPDNLVLFRKSILTLSGVLSDLSADYTLDRIMLSSGLRQFSKELTARVLTAPGSRAFGTHVSNVDLMGLWSAWPSTAVAYWLGFWEDCLAVLQSSPRNVGKPEE
jgi:ubiquinone biosynthesis protein